MPDSKKTKPATSKTESMPSVIAPNTKFVLDISWEKVEPAYTSSVEKLSRRLKLKGFRAGKVPRQLAEKYLDPNELINETLDKVLPDLYRQYLEKEQKRPLTYPEIKPIKVEKGQAWQVQVEIAEAPQVTLGKYQAIIKKGLEKAEKDIAEQTKKAKTETKEVKTAPGANAQPEPRDLKLRQVFSALVTEIKPAIPELLIRNEVKHELQHLAESLAQIKMTVDEYLKKREMTFEQLTGELASTSLARLQLEFILASIGQDQKLFATDKEVEAQLAKLQPAAHDHDDSHHDHDHAGHDHSHTHQIDPAYRQQLQTALTKQKILDWLVQ